MIILVIKLTDYQSLIKIILLFNKIADIYSYE